MTIILKSKGRVRIIAISHCKVDPNRRVIQLPSPIFEEDKSVVVEIYHDGGSDEPTKKDDAP